jgi:hypothetical protein
VKRTAQKTVPQPLPKSAKVATPEALTIPIEDFGRGMVSVAAETDQGSVHIKVRRTIGEREDLGNPTVVVAPHFMASPTFDIGQHTNGRGFYLTLDVAALEDLATGIIGALALARRANLIPSEAQ